ncbi:hypothetical protein [Brevibacillus fortis]|uniref:hypothetical protein n=1 Tax=Brevibacillus fortis TaxID=2126352 RepID=UPI0038FCBB71
MDWFCLLHNVEDPWWEQPWEIPDIDMVLEQLKKIRTASLKEVAKELLVDLCKMLSSAKKLNEPVWIADE